MSNKKIIKTELNNKAVKNNIEFYKTTGKPFKFISSNYTATIETEDVIIKFLKEERTGMFFSLYKELEREVTLFINNNPLINIPEYINYYSVNYQVEIEEETIYNIDLTSAYLYVLKNDKIISQSLFEKLNKLDKMDRLSIVGMLASKKTVFHFDNRGKINNVTYLEKKELRNIFFYCVWRISFLAENIKELIGSNLIFTWVDGFYFLDDFGASKDIISRFLNLFDYPHKFEELKNFKLKVEDDFFNIEFKKNGLIKPFKIPINKSNFADEIYLYLQKTNEKEFLIN